MKKRRKLKKGVYYFFFLIVIAFVAILYVNNYISEKKYKESYEYKLIEHGYSKTEAEKLLEVFKDPKYIDYILSIYKNDKIMSLIEEEYFLPKNIEKYLDYLQRNRKKELSVIVRNVNIHIDNDFYQNMENTDISLKEQMLVNKHFKLSEDYIPDNLVSVSQSYSWGEKDTVKVTEETYNAFLKMWEAAKEDGYYLMINSAYRSYQDQEAVYNKKPQSQADKVAARPGSSEHQTGLAIDVFSKTHNNQATFKDSEAAKWLKENSYKYGFILRYPEGKENLTGYSYEAWHYRYVGEDVAKKVYETGLTYDEYYAYYIEK